MYYRDDVSSSKAIPVLVTGAGRGIGKRLAIGFAAQGARVGLLARSKPELDLCHLEIEHGGGTALRMRADIAEVIRLLDRQFGASTYSLRTLFRDEQRRVLREQVPECELVATSNSELNAHMNTINEAMGYRQLETLVEYHRRI